ncbi:DUF2294 family protein [Paenibacillus nanensis]|uniref:DUF2294 family protein n=1 Tax=Paenibacillus nanensis TaxID=393251 RepID=A0A3A1ULT4_9BACL|nr:Na-translocating system protein MpsC family protein [Paenibacillus nanensis]RIX48642.1 DUF2294 family protein [Paenibacillus nanensis]
MNENYYPNEIASHVGKLLRDAFGKGPQSIHVSMNWPFIVIYLRNFLTPTERILLRQGQVRSIQHTRDIVMTSLIPEIKAYLLLLTGMNIVEFYYDWELHNYSGVFVGRQQGSFEPETVTQESYTGKDEVHREIDYMSSKVQKSPDCIYSCMINKRTLLVARSGILTDMSKELIRLGYEENLKQAVHNLEKKHLREFKQFQHILKAKVADAFVDWNFKLDRSAIVFILNPFS